MTSGHWAAPGLVVMGPDGRPGHRRHAGGDRLRRRALLCAAGSHPHDAASSRLRTGPDLSPGLYTELTWRIGPAVDPLPFLAVHLTRVASLTVDVTRVGLASLSASTINVVTDTPAQIKLAALPPDSTVLLDGQPTSPTMAVPVGRHTVTLRTT